MRESVCLTPLRSKAKPIVKPLEDIYIVESYKQYNKVDPDLMKQINSFENG